MIVKKSDSAIQHFEVDLDATNLLDYSSQKETLTVWALPIETTYLPSQTMHAPTDNRLKNRIFFELVRMGEYVHVSVDKTEIKILSGSLITDFSGLEENRFAPVKDATSWAENYAELNSTARLRSVSRDTVQRIKDFALLEDNWDSYGAKQIRWGTIVRAIDFFNKVVLMNPSVPLPFVSPAPTGDIHFEWEMCSRSLLHLIPDSDEGVFDHIITDKTSGKIEKTVGKAFSISEMVEIVSGCMLNQYV